MSEPAVQLTSLHNLIANTIRGLAMDAVQEANSGHPGMPMGMADVAAVLWSKYLKFDPSHPDWPDRDRFVLSAGHGSMLLYSLLYLAGYDLPLEEIKNFRQWGSKTPGHPEVDHTPGVETTTGPLGQGLSNAVGMAMAERWLAQRFNRPGHEIIDHHTYVIASDGDLMEGISHEACALAGHLGLSKLIALYDDNQISIDGPTSLSYSDDVPGRFAAYGWHTLQVDGHNADAIAAAIDLARAEGNRPTLISCKTHIGFGSPNRQDTAKVHGSPLGDEELRLTKENLGWPQERFYVDEQALAHMRQAGEAGGELHRQWGSALETYGRAFPEEAAELKQFLHGELPDGWADTLPRFTVDQVLATRAASGTVLESLVPQIPNLIGGSADLTGSNKTKTKGGTHWTRDSFAGQYIHYGIREHGMGGIMNGMILHGGIRPYGGTFLVFSDYMRPAVRLAALMGRPVIYVFSHDSIGLGEDGPTHQPIGHLMALRNIPNLVVFRPADGNETTAGWLAALQRQEGPTALILTRQKLPTLNPAADEVVAGAQRGAYVLSDAADARVLLLASGSEVEIALEAQALLAERQVPARVVSMPSWELFAAQPAEYREQVLPPGIAARVSIEAGTTLGWERHVVGGAALGLDHYGASAPYETLYEKFGLTAEAVVAAALAQLD